MKKQRARMGTREGRAPGRAPPSKQPPEWGQTLADDAVALRSVLDGMAEAVVVADATGRLVYFNRAAEQLHGIGLTGEPPEGWGKRYGIFREDGATPCPPDQIPLARAIRGEGPDHVALWVRRPDGSGTPVEVNGRPIRAGRRGPVLGGVVVFSDITERRRVANALQVQRKRFEDVLEGLPVFTLLLTPDYHVRYANRRFREIFGDPGSRRCYEALFGFAEPCPHCQSFVCLRTHAPHQWEWQSPEGRTFQIHDRPFVDQDGAELVLEMGLDVTERRRAEEQLKASSSYARGLIEASLDPLVTISAEGKITDVNAATEVVTGVERSELIGSDFSDYFTEPDLARAGYQAVFAQGTVRDYPLTIRHRSGTATDVLYNATVYRDAQGSVEGVFAAARDITERKRAEERLRASSGYARGLIEASLDPLVTISVEGKITDVNAATEAVTGIPRGDLIGSDFSNYFTEPERARAGYRAVFAQGFVRDYPLTIRHRSGATTDVLYNATVYRDAQGSVEGVFAAARDITERKRNEREIGRLNRLYRVLSRAGEAMVRVQSAEALCDEACRIAVEVGGFRMAWVGVRDPAAALLRPAAAFGQHREYAEQSRFSVDDVAEGRGPTGSAYREGRPFICRDIEREPQMAPWRDAALAAGFRSSASFPLRSASEVRAVFTVYSGEAGRFGEEEIHLLDELTSNISYAMETLEHEERRRRAEEEVRALNETLERRVAERTAELAAANDELQAFAYSVSHDLRAPLRSINGFSQALAEDSAKQLDEAGLGHLRRIQAATRRMGGMIDDLLKLSRVTRSEMHRERVDLSALAAEVVADLRREAKGRRAEVVIEPALVTYADRSLTRIVLENLLGNAWKFTAPRESARIEVGQGALDDRPAAFVRDNGVGFDMKFVDRLFVPFQRLHTAAEFEGTGIGLATVHRIVQRHGGRIVASGSSEGGAQFTFRLE